MEKTTKQQIQNISTRLARLESLMMAEAIADEHELTGEHRGKFMESVRSRAKSGPVSERDMRDLASSTRDKAELLRKTLG